MWCPIRRGHPVTRGEPNNGPRRSVHASCRATAADRRDGEARGAAALAHRAAYVPNEDGRERAAGGRADSAAQGAVPLQRRMYHAARDTMPPRGIPCHRAGYHAVRDTMPCGWLRLGAQVSARRDIPQAVVCHTARCLGGRDEGAGVLRARGVAVPRREQLHPRQRVRGPGREDLQRGAQGMINAQSNRA